MHEKPFRRLVQCRKDIVHRGHEESVEVSGEGQVGPLSPETIKLKFPFRFNEHGNSGESIDLRIKYAQERLQQL